MAAAAVPQAKTLSKTVKEKTLREILDGLVISQKQDIIAFSKGHLNESNLPKPPNKAKYTSWRSAMKPNIRLVPKSTIPPLRRDIKHSDGMNTTLMHFSIGTAGNTYVSGKPKPTPVSKPPTVLSARTRYSATSRKSDGVLVEELKLPEAMLAKSEYRDSKSKLVRSSIDLQPDSERLADHTVENGAPQERLLPALRHEFMSGHLEAVTKKDQLLKMRQFDEVVLRKQDATEQNVMSGVKAVAHLEAKLQEDLDQLQSQAYGPNFHRLQVFSNIFDDLIEDSTTFGFVLQTMKNEYDAYIASLLDSQVARHQVLQGQVEQLTSQGQTSDILREEMNNVQLMEQDGRQLLDENDRLRKELEQEKYLMHKPVEQELGSGERKLDLEETRHDLQEQIEVLRANILEKLDMMNALKTKLRCEHVPSTVCSHLEQCIKETEVEFQKLTSQKEFFERSISDMEKDLHQAIETADTTEKDSRRVWKRVMAVKAVDRSVLHGLPGAGVTTTGPGGATPDPYHDSDDDQDDIQKWNWYIS